MEFLVLSAVLGTGYVLNKNNNDNNDNNYTDIDSPLYNDVDNMDEPNRKLLRNDYTAKRLPLEFKDGYKINDNRLESSDKSPNYLLNEMSKKVQEESVNTKHGYSLTGEKIDPKKFVHNNMVPFFGGSVKQSVDEYSTRAILDNFTGNDSTYQKKKEVPYMFDPQANVGNPYGSSNMAGYQQERYVASNRHANSTPIEKTYVGPGLNNGYTAKPDGGYQQAAARDYIMPKTVDQLRVKTNPKMTYQGRINPGKKISRGRKIGVVKKRTVETFYQNTPDRYFTEVGAHKAPRLRPAHILPLTNREQNGPDNHFGPARSTRTKEASRAKVAKSRRIALKSSGMRHLNGKGRWSMKDTNNKKNGRQLHDYGKSGIKIKPNSRQITQKCTQTMNLKGLSKQGRAPINRKLKITKRVGHEKNAKWASNVQASRRGPMVVNPDMIAKTTTRETTLYANETGGGAKGHNAARIHNPNDRAKTTTRETTLSEYTGNANGHKRERSQASARNCTVRSLREEISRGRVPTKVGPKLIRGKENVKMTTRKTNKLNKIISERKQIRSNLHIIPGVDTAKFNFTKQRKCVKDKNLYNRLDPYMVDAFKKNPYTQSLSSSY